ncbi:MAG TPA: PQQ-binding-like beta-propeller repeat protein [Pirellulales bacterium]
MSTLDRAANQSSPDPRPAASAPSAKPNAARVWPIVVLVGIYWAVMLALRLSEAPIYVLFMTSMAASLGLLLLVAGWWLTNGTLPRRERLVGFLALVLGGIAAGILCDPSVGPMGLIFSGIPFVLTAWAVWLVVARHNEPLRRVGLVLLTLGMWGFFTLVRADGIDGDNQAAISFRWSPTREEQYLATLKNEQAAQPATDEVAALTADEGDWPEFRGPNRLGEVHGVRIATDWTKSPPKELWRKRIGPAWSSVVIIGNRLFTGEQRGDQECAVCLDTESGNEIWVHKDTTRFTDGQAGAGPRATPTFYEGALFTQGASGVLDCLDAATGKLKWTRNIATDSGAPLPMWGFSSSPLVADGIVVAYSGAPGDKGLLGYRQSDGEPVWTAATGVGSYSSPQLATIGGQQQVLFFSDLGLMAVDAKTGAVRWKHDAASPNIWRVVQPRQLDAGSFLIGSEDLGLVRLEVTPEGDSWKSEQRYASRALRPAYNDFVVLNGTVYGFDESIFCAIDVETGKRRWKSGRYGHGQVLLLADQPLLLVLSESGEVILVAANPEKHEELARLEAVHGKTWNHPVIAHGKLFVRNDEEIACYELPPAE